MSWKIGKKFKDSGLLSGKSHSSTPAVDSRSTTPTPGNPHPGHSAPSSGVASATGSGAATPPVARSGILRIRVTAGKGLTLPQGVSVPQPVANAIQQHPTSVLSQSLSSSPRHQTRPSIGNRDTLARRQLWWLPYVVLEFDKNEVLVDALGGDLANPVWMYSATFDVSRISEISVNAYLRTAPPKSGDASDMGNADLALGGIRFTPNLETNRLTDEWIPITSGSGAIHVQVSFKPAQAPLTIDSFELLKVIGKGSFGKVMQVRKRDTLRIYALKTIRKAHIVSRSEVTHTLAERTVLAQVNNPFIVPLKFSFQSKEKLYLVLAFVNGGELFHHLQREGKFNETRSRFYAAELLLALEHLHSFNVVYRDLKPENILLDYTGHIALCDFGLCKLNMGSDETTNTFCGTPEYLAPELLSGHGYTKCVDWWTLGVLLYEMLTGLPPFYDENTNEMYRKILSDPLRFPDEVGPEARSLLTKLLDRDPSRRLGVNGAQEIKDHPFFARHIDFKKLLQKKIPPPFKPSVASAIDTSNFDEEFTSEVPQDSVVADSHLSQTVQQQFEGFSWSVSPLGESVGRGY
ncbi:proliferation-associated serine/threonine protein kinase [Trichosporon asahii var. asahii CBS 8904]|uniref:non-specific serine/threonine protein kinase n=2 Tax=Trichosporon asahii var. asahii TaxID=189963 RepID=K1WFR8_TRIAC|nr:proliferation-associated serine/threonine protein kinase [Trichosporon asahii var. asahii CBS 2479]EJT45182.1 proliferation-associated serine/threonine protein kinase [Trichosporon asahii var. asahii CBS 2479]EKD00414.1 proliferation-associated serine/threonine protein kinase [Trichosporon asahii var. asahii CBS 8904]